MATEESPPAGHLKKMQVYDTFQTRLCPWFLCNLWLYHRNNLFFPSFQVHSIQIYQRRDHQRHLLAGWMIFMDIRATKEEVSLLFYCEVSLHHQHHLRLYLLCFCVSVYALVQMTITHCTHRPLHIIPNLNKTEAHQCPTSGTGHVFIKGFADDALLYLRQNSRSTNKWSPGGMKDFFLQGPLGIGGCSQRCSAQICGIQMELQLQACQESHLQRSAAHHSVQGRSHTCGFMFPKTNSHQRDICKKTDNDFYFTH